MPRVAILGSRLNVVEGAAAAGVDVVLLHQPGVPQRQAYELAEQVIAVDLADRDAVESAVLALHTEDPFDRVITLTEPCLVMAAGLNEQLGLGGNSTDSVLMLKDKARMRAVLASAGLSPVATRIVTSATALREFLAQLGRPAIVKPTDAMGSEHVHRVATAAAADAAWQDLSAAGITTVLAEEFLEGPEISVEGISGGGKHTLVTSTGKILGPGFVETGHTMPAPLLDPAARDEVYSLVSDFLMLSDLTEGPSHTEIMLTSSGPRIIESHNRIGGGMLNDLIMLSTGLNLAALAVTVPLGLEPLPGPPSVSNGAAIRFFVTEPGRVVSVAGLAEAAAVPGTELGEIPPVGAVIPPMQSSADRVSGYVIGHGADAAEAAARCDEVLRLVRISTVPAVIAS